MGEQKAAAETPAKNALILMGIKHCGKSTQGKLLAKHFSCAFYDTDDVVRELTGKTPRELYTQHGEAAFIAAEEHACAHLAQKLQNRKAVIATGGGICKNSKAVEILRSLGTLVFLNAQEKTAADRIVREVTVAEDGSLKNLPAYIAREHPTTLDEVRASFHRFYTERSRLYTMICSVRVDMASAPPEENMQTILKAVSGGA